MFVDDVQTSAEHRLNQVLHTLKYVHGIQLHFEDSTADDIAVLRDQHEVLKNSIVTESAFNSYHTNPDYAKHMLIIEAARIYLSEIAPRRRRRRMFEGTGVHHRGDRFTKIGRWLMDFAEKAVSKDDTILSVLNSFGRVGEDMTSIGSPFGPKSFKDLVAGYESRANDEMNDDADRQQAKDNIRAMRIGFKLYDKHHPTGETTSEAIGMEEAPAVQERKSHAHIDHELEDLMRKYGVEPATEMIPEDDMDEGNEFTGALAAARARGDDSFTVDGKTFKVSESELLESHMQPHDYQASMARAELYRNAKYGMDMLKMIRPDGEVEPWIAACLTKDAMYLDEIYHYMDYYMKFEPNELSGSQRPDLEALSEDLGETSGSVARQNLLQIIEYSIKLFQMIQPGDHLEGWVAMKLTTASEGISSCKHYLDYKNFEQHAADRFDESSRKKKHVREADMKHVQKRKSKISEALDNPEQDLQHAETLIAAKSISSDLQSMAEKVARMGVDELMPLVDTMKTQFGPDAADAYNQVMKTQLDSLLQSVQTAKDQSDNAVLALQAGRIPGQATDIEAAQVASADAEPMANPEEIEPSDGFGTTQADAGGNEPLGRAKKEPMAEGHRKIMLEVQDLENAIITLQNIIAAAGPAQNAAGQPMHKIGDKDLTDLYKVINYLKNTQYNSSKAGVNDIKEAWGTTMKTAEKDKGKWDGYTIAQLKAKKKKLMDKESRSAAEQKTVKQIDFAIRAKQKNKWGKIKEEGVNEVKKSKPDFLDVDKDGDKKEPMKKAIKDKAKKGVKEAKQAKSPYAIGMWQAKKEAGMDPDKPAKDLPKKMIKRAHEIARGIDKTDESVAKLNTLLDKTNTGIKMYERTLKNHRKEFASMVAEGAVKDILGHGQGIEGDIISKKIAKLREMSRDLQQQIANINEASEMALADQVGREKKAYRFAQARAVAPYGVMFESDTGQRDYKFFKDQQAREYWMQLHGNDKTVLINPDHFDIAATR